MIATGLARQVVTVRPDPVRVAAARLDRVGESLRAMSSTAGGSLSRAAPDVGVESLTSVCDSAAAASRIRLAGLGEWSALLADRLRQAVELYAGVDSAAARAVAMPSGVVPAAGMATDVAPAGTMPVGMATDVAPAGTMPVGMAPTESALLLGGRQ